MGYGSSGVHLFMLWIVGVMLDNVIWGSRRPHSGRFLSRIISWLGRGFPNSGSWNVNDQIGPGVFKRSTDIARVNDRIIHSQIQRQLKLFLHLLSI